MNTTGHNFRASIESANRVTVRGTLARAPKTTYSNVEAGWVEISWDGDTVRTPIYVCDGGRGVPDYWWGHTFPTISSERLPRLLWSKVVDLIKDRNARVGDFEATLDVPGIAAPLAAAA
jgi:hypothetical protein